MKIAIGLSDRLISEQVWIDIWRQLNEQTENFPFELVNPDSGFFPWYEIDWQNGPFTFSLKECGIKFALTEFYQTKKLGFYLSSLILSFLLQKCKQVFALEASYPNGILEENIEIDIEQAAIKYLTIVKNYNFSSKNRNVVRCFRLSENKLAILCVNEKAGKDLTGFFDKMETQGWEFKRFEGGS